MQEPAWNLIASGNGKLSPPPFFLAHEVVTLVTLGTPAVKDKCVYHAPPFITGSSLMDV